MLVRPNPPCRVARGYLELELNTVGLWYSDRITKPEAPAVDLSKNWHDWDGVYEYMCSSFKPRRPGDAHRTS